MAETPRVTLIFDPFAISKEAGVHIFDFHGELQAFHDIDDLLRRDARLETVVPKTYVISAGSVEHFKSYQGVNDVQIRYVTPRSSLRDIFRCDPPDWISDNDICRWRLLELSPPRAMSDEGWAATFASWLIPGIGEAGSLGQWLRVVGSAADQFADNYGSDPVSIWIQERFARLASDEVSSREIVLELRADLTRSKSPIEFAREWMRRRACLPLMRTAHDSPLRVVGLEHESPRSRAIADRLPFTFPLPKDLHEEVSQLFCKAMQRVRIHEKHRLSEAVQSLNAVWYGIPEEIRSWLEVFPKGLNRSAATHLSGLPGFETSELLRRLVGRYRPPEPVAPWPGLTGDIEQWVVAYSHYIRSCFLRRDLNEATDPANDFGRWLKDHHTVCFDHRTYSYFRVARSVQDALRSDRLVVLVMIDAFPIHLAADLIGYMADGLAEGPTTSSYIFVPVPTVTHVCKEAVLTGKLPRECRGDLASQLRHKFGLGEEELHIAANWQDAERLQITADARLVVYRDNRLDDQLHKLASYRALLEDSHGVFQRIAALLKRWSHDVRFIRHEAPLILVTADHGFTYGPTPGSETSGHFALDGTHRCVLIDGQPSSTDMADDSITVIDKDLFRLRSTYLAARGRYFGKGTMSGWSMSHGGLLPEEVIVPYLEWFGQEESMSWPTITFPEGIVIDQDQLVVVMVLENDRSQTTLQGSLTVSVSGEDARTTRQLPPLAAGNSTRITLEITMPRPPQGDKLPIDVLMQARSRKGTTPIERAEQFLVPRARRLVEKTREQADFEDMF